MSGHGETDSGSTVAASNEEHLPAEEVLAPDESPTPLWLPLVGLTLTLVALLFWVVSGSDEESRAATARRAGQAGERPSAVAADSDRKLQPPAGRRRPAGARPHQAVPRGQAPAKR
jgi:hypothetical protein